MCRVLALVSDAYGGRGGIAQFSTDMLSAIAVHPRCTEVVALPRTLAAAVPVIPSRITFLKRSAGSKLRYLGEVVREVTAGRRFDLVICGHVNLLPLAALAARVHRAPLVTVLYGIEAWKPHASPIVRRLLARVDLFVSISAHTWKKFDAWADIRAARHVIVPCCVDLRRFTPGPKRTDLLERYALTGATVVMTMARLAGKERYKGIDEMLVVLSMLAAERPSLRYLIVGDGSDRQRLEDKAASLGVRDRVVFAGYVDEAEKADHYRLADVFAMPGRGEGFGIVFLEALACGVPVVASVLDASQETVLDGALGELVDPRDVSSVRRGVEAALTRATGVQSTLLTRFSHTQWQQRWHRLLDEVIVDRHARAADGAGTPRPRVAS